MKSPGLARRLGGFGETLEQTTHPAKIIDLLGMPLHGNHEASLGRLNGFDDAIVRLSGNAKLGCDGLDGLMVQAVDPDICLVDELREPRVRVEAHAVDHGAAHPAVGVRMFDLRDPLVSKILPEAAA